MGNIEEEMRSGEEKEKIQVLDELNELRKRVKGLEKSDMQFKQAQEKLRTASLYSRSLIEASLDPLVTISTDGKITDVNKATEEVTGISRDKLIGSDFSNYFTQPGKAREGYKRVFTDGFVRNYPLAIRHISGKITDVLYNASVYMNEIGKVQGVFAAARDITERKHAEEKVHVASLYARNLIEASPDPLVTISPQGKITDVNKATELATGVSREELIGSDFSDYFTEPDKARKGYQEVFEIGFVRDYPLAIKHVSGKIIDVLYNATVYRNESGDVLGIFAAARDITERKFAEDALRESELKYRIVADNTYDWEYWRSPDDQFIYISPSCTWITGHTAEEFSADSGLFNRIIHPDDRKGFESHHGEVKKKKVNGEVEFRIILPDGKHRWIYHVCQPVFDNDGHYLGIRSSNRDITELKHIEEKLRQIV